MKLPATWSMTGDKAALRGAIKAQKITGDSDAILRNLLAHPWYREAKTVMAYCAIPPEPDLTKLLSHILREKKTLLLPRCEGDTTMTARQVQDLSMLAPGAFGIPEPGEELPVAEKEAIDLILVPALAFDREGHRLGRGKGYYDRYLQNFCGKTLGVCFSAALLDTIPCAPHDCPVQGVVTEEMIRSETED